MPDISKIKLPSGNTYEIKDAVARQAIAGGISFVLAWDGASTPVPSKIPAGVKVVYQGTTYTGTLAAYEVQEMGFYLVKSSTQVEALDVYDEYAVVTVSGTKRWEKIGDTHIDLSIFGQLAYKDNVAIAKGDGDNVLGEATTFSASTSAVTFTGGTSKSALGANATFDGSPVYRPRFIYATAEGADVEIDEHGEFITSIGETSSKLETGTVHDTPTLTKKYLATKTVKEVAGNTDVSIPNVTNVADVSVPVVSGNIRREIPNVESVGGASTWGFALGSGSDAETLIISGGNGWVPTLGDPIYATDTTFGTSGSASKVTLGTALSASKVTTANSTVASGQVADTAGGAAVGIEISAGSVKTFATGAVSASGTGASVITGVSPTTGLAATDVAMAFQPTIKVYATYDEDSLAGKTYADVDEISDINVYVDSKDAVAAITSIGTGTAAAQTITAGTNDKVKVAKYDDLGVTVS